jgi:ornithine cyclodeaminase
MRLLTRSDVEALLDVRRLIDALAPAMADLSAGRIELPPRVGARVPERDAVLGVMPVYHASAGTLATKLVTVFPQNPASGPPSHQAVVLVFDPETGTPHAIMDATVITAVRTAAGSALATRLLARADADVLAIVGTGVQARAHARAIPHVRAVREVRVFGRDAAAARRLADEISAELGVPASVAASFREAAAGAGIVCATTHAAEPVVEGRWLEPGTHVNSVGLNPRGREVDGDAIVRSLVVVESRRAALEDLLAGANDLLWPIRDGLVGVDHIHAEVGELVAGTRPGRTSPDEVTLYKSVGIALQDAVAARLVLDAAAEQGIGVDVTIG